VTIPRAFLIDIDGVLYVGSQPIPGAPEAIQFLQRHGYPHRFISNTTRKSRATIAAQLRRMGFSVGDDAILTPAVAAAEWVKKHGNDRCYLLATGDVAADFEAAGIVHAEQAEIVVIGDAGDRATYAAMNHAFRLVMGGARLVALERDRFWMASDGLSLSAGPFVAALEFATGAKATVIGKPSPDFFLHALNQLGCRAEETAMVGDDIETDIKGAQRCGCAGYLVRTGKFNEERLASSGVVPDLVLDSIAALPTLLSMHT